MHKNSFRSTASSKTILRVLSYLKKYPWLAFGTISCAIGSTISALAFPFLLSFIIDDVIVLKKIKLLLPVAALLGLAFFLRDLLNSLRIRINNVLEQNIIFDIRTTLYDKLQKLPVLFYENRSTGDLMTRVIEDVNSVERVLIDGAEISTVNSIQILVIVIYMVTIDPLLAGVTLLPFPLMAIAVVIYTKSHPCILMLRRPIPNASHIINSFKTGDLGY